MAETPAAAGYDHASRPYRASKFVDFNTGEVLVSPHNFVDRHPRPWSIEAEIDFFQCRVEVWQLSPAVAILDQIESHENPSAWSHAAYSLLFILTPYFEMVGKILNAESTEYKSSDRDFNYGFQNIYPNLIMSERAEGTTSFKDNAFPFIGQFRDRMRNGITHLGFTKSTFDVHNSKQIPDDVTIQFVTGTANDTHALGVYLLNPHRMTRTIVEHCGKFTDKLRASKDLHAQFREFVSDYHDPHADLIVKLPTKT